MAFSFRYAELRDREPVVPAKNRRSATSLTGGTRDRNCAASSSETIWNRRRRGACRRHSRHPASRRAPALARTDGGVAEMGRTSCRPDACCSGQDHPGLQESDRHQSQTRTVNANDLQSRITSGIQSGAGARHHHGLRQLDAALLPIAQPTPATSRGDRQSAGRLLRGLSKQIAGRRQMDRRTVVGRKSRLNRLAQIVAFREAGASTFPETGTPTGQSASSHKNWLLARPPVTLSATPGWWYPHRWSWRQGGRGRRQDRGPEQQGNRRVDCSAVALWKETMDEGGLAWDDTNNNRALLS